MLIYGGLGDIAMVRRRRNQYGVRIIYHEVHEGYEEGGKSILPQRHRERHREEKGMGKGREEPRMYTNEHELFWEIVVWR